MAFRRDEPAIFDNPNFTGNTFDGPAFNGPIIPVEPEEPDNPATLEGVMDNDRGEWFGWDFWNGGGQPRHIQELTKGDWRPTRMRFDERWAAGEIPNHWYENRYRNLFRLARKFAVENFGYGDLPTPLAAGEGGSGFVWLEGTSKHFRCFVKKIAKQDKNAGGWDELLVKRRNREWLLTGVIGKVLETCVFEDLLFGADEGAKEMLEAQDECTLEFEGEKIRLC